MSRLRHSRFSAYRAGWHWGCVCGLVAGTTLTALAVLAGRHFG